MKKNTILLTGASGNMGQAGLKELLERKDEFQIVLFSLPTKKDKKILKPYEKKKNIRIVWGDLTNYEDVCEAVKGVDIVLHLGALVSPMADKHPKLAWKINYGGTKNLVDAVLQMDHPEEIKFVYVGTVAETGNREAPFHWGRVGDPLNPAFFDYYALSKIAGERYVIESELKNWVSIRQTGMMHENIFSVRDGIEFHQPLNNHLEWVTAKDSGRLLARICDESVPKDFWRNVYNVGGGESCRLTAFQFMEKLFHVMEVDIKDIYDPNMFALKNFHGHYYLDSDKLENILHFRSESIDDVLPELKKNLPSSLKLVKYLPKKIIKHYIKKQSRRNPSAPLYWIAHNKVNKIKAFFGNLLKWSEIGGWECFVENNDPPYTLLNHGYDEKKKDKDLLLKDIKKAAIFRGGKCLSKTMKKGDLTKNFCGNVPKGILLKRVHI